MEVYTNVLVGGVELDLVAVESLPGRPVVYVVEVKSRPKSKLLNQVLNRLEVSDYVYAALPVRHYFYLLWVPEPVGSLAVDLENMVVYEIKKPKYVGNGGRLLEELRSRPLRGVRAVRTDTRIHRP